MESATAFGLRRFSAAFTSFHHKMKSADKSAQSKTWRLISRFKESLPGALL